MERGREAWVRRVAEWRQSGLTAPEFAATIGVKAATLSHWAWQLGRERRARSARRDGGRARATTAPALIEVVSMGDVRFELELANGRRLRVPPSFEPAALERLLSVLEQSR